VSGRIRPLHHELVDSVKALQQKVLQMDRPMAEEEIDFLERWLTGHILSTDMQLGSYLSEVM